MKYLIASIALAAAAAHAAPGDLKADQAATDRAVAKLEQDVKAQRAQEAAQPGGRPLWQWFALGLLIAAPAVVVVRRRK
jgi:hypothetical protein